MPRYVRLFTGFRSALAERRRVEFPMPLTTDLKLRSSICACTNLRRATRAVCNLYDLVLAPTGLKSTQFMVLQVIAESGELAQCDLAREFAVSVETLSRRLASARKAGLVEVFVGERQRRMYTLTGKGRDRLEEASPFWERAQLRLRESLGDAAWNALPQFADYIAESAIRAERKPSANGRPRPADAGPSRPSLSTSRARAEHVAVATHS